MRLLKLGAFIGSVLLYPTLVSGQTVKQADIIGMWQRNIELQVFKKPSKGTSWLTLWPDSLWAYAEKTPSHGDGGQGRWRLAGDTLYLAFDFDYGMGVGLRVAALCQSQSPTSGPLLSDSLPQQIDPAYWSGSHKMKFNDSSVDIRAYKVTHADQQLSLIPLDSLTKNPRNNTALAGAYNVAQSQGCD